jgi:hypothetical protein
MKKLFAACVLGATVLGLSGPTLAHHSFAMFNPDKQLVFTGIVVRVAPNPDHQHIQFVPLTEDRTDVVRGADGKPVVWLLEMEAAAQAARQGVTVAAFPQGTVFSVGLHPLRDGGMAGSRGLGAGAEAASAIFKCPAKARPGAGLHCDSVEGTQHFGDSDALPVATETWTP